MVVTGHGLLATLGAGLYVLWTCHVTVHPVGVSITPPFTGGQHKARATHYRRGGSTVVTVEGGAAGDADDGHVFA